MRIGDHAIITAIVLAIAVAVAPIVAATIVSKPPPTVADIPVGEVCLIARVSKGEFVVFQCGRPCAATTKTGRFTRVDDGA